LKKSASLFLLFVFLFNIAGVIGLFTLLKLVNYESVFNRDAKDLSLVRLSIPKSEKIFWKNKNEFVYEGNHYDVFKHSSDEENNYFLCHLDNKENSLFDVFKNHLTNQLTEKNTGKQDNNRNNVKVIIQDFIVNTFCWRMEISISGNVLDRNLLPHSSEYSTVFSPPPEIS